MKNRDARPFVPVAGEIVRCPGDAAAVIEERGMELVLKTLEELAVDDERSFRHVELYADLKAALVASKYRFRVVKGGASFDRVLFLNLTFWDASEQGDVLAGDHVPADVVAHVAWHHLASRAFPHASAEALLFAEAVASAFDLYLVGRLLGHAPDSEFLETQVPAMSAAASEAGMSEQAFEAMLEETSRDPERAFEDLRALLFDAGTELARAKSVSEAAKAMTKLDGRRFAELLHHYELSNWILSARGKGLEHDAAVRSLDEALRTSSDSVGELAKRWLASQGQRS